MIHVSTFSFFPFQLTSSCLHAAERSCPRSSKSSRWNEFTSTRGLWCPLRDWEFDHGSEVVEPLDETGRSKLETGWKWYIKTGISKLDGVYVHLPKHFQSHDLLVALTCWLEVKGRFHRFAFQEFRIQKSWEDASHLQHMEMKKNMKMIPNDDFSKMGMSILKTCLMSFYNLTDCERRSCYPWEGGFHQSWNSWYWRSTLESHEQVEIPVADFLKGQDQHRCESHKM